MAGKDLPDEIAVKILYRLAVKSLLRFRSVSKRWRLIISDPQFAKSQFELASFQLESQAPPLLQINACPHKDEIKRNNCSVRVLLGCWNLGMHEQMLGQLKFRHPRGSYCTMPFV